MPEEVKVAIDVGLADGDAVLPGDIYRLAVERGLVHVFPTTLDFPCCSDVLADWTPPEEAQDDVLVGLHQDPATDITLVYVVSPPGRAALGQRLSESLLAAFTIAELVEGMVG
jgi:hypothetical protein